jgi:hypothetical protein
MYPMGVAEPGVYRSELDGHLYILKFNPIRLTCAACSETCNLSEHNVSDRKKIAEAFTTKHGYLGHVKLADSILQLIPPVGNESKQ